MVTRQTLKNWTAAAFPWPPEKPVSDWIEENIYLPRGVSSNPGPFSFALTPYLIEPVNAIQDPATQEIVLCTSTQVGKTTALVLILSYFLAVDPWNAMTVFPSEANAIEFNVEAVQPIIAESPTLAALRTGAKHDMTREAIRLNGCTASFIGANSPGDLSRRPVKVLLLDEVDKYPRWSGNEADPIELAQERTKTFHDSLILKSSTPTTNKGYIWHELLSSTNERFEVPCPFCGTFQRLVFGNGEPSTPGVKWPKNVTAEDLLEDESLAWYECAQCGGRITDRHKSPMVRAGRWVPQGQKLVGDRLVGDAPSKRKRGFHLWAAYSLWPKASFANVAAQFLRSKDADQKLMNFRNSWLAEPWEIVFTELKDQHIRGCAGEYGQGTAPENAWLITAGVDVQSISDRTYQYYVIRAWGAEGESWLVRAGLSESWEFLNQILFLSQYKNTAGEIMPLRMVLIDSGYKTDEVYQFCDITGCYPAKGIGRARKHLSISELPVAPGSDQTIPLVLLDGDFFKGKLHRLIRSEKWHIHAHVQEEYFSHMLAEQMVSDVDKKTGRTRVRWKVVSDGRPNHYFDAEVYALAAADMIEVGNLAARPAGARNKEKAQPPSAKTIVIKDTVFSDG